MGRGLEPGETMITENRETPPAPPAASPPTPPARPKRAFLLVMLATAVVTLGVVALLMNIFTRKQEAKNPYLKFVEVTEETTDPAEWGKNWPREYDGYKRTVEPSKTNFGGGDAGVP